MWAPLIKGVAYKNYDYGFVKNYNEPTSSQYRAVTLLLESGADVNSREEFSTVFRTAQRKRMRSIEGQ